MPDELNNASTAVSEAPSAATESVSTPAAEPTSQAETVVTEQPSEPVRPTRNEGESDLEFLQRVRKEREPKQPEQKQVEPKPAETTEPKQPEQQPEQKPAETAELDPELELEDGSPLPIKELADRLKADPELDAKLEASGLKNQLFASARLASQAAQYKQVFPDVEAAKFARQNAEAYAQLDDAVIGIDPNDPTTVQPLIQLLMQNDLVLNPDGTPKLNQDGTPQLQGYVPKLLTALANESYDAAIRAAQASGDEDLQAAAEILKAWMNGTPPAENQNESEAVKAERAAINAEKTALHQQRIDAQKAEWNKFEDGILDESNKSFDQMITSIISQTDLSERDKNNARRDIRDALAETLSKDKLYLSYRESLARRGMNDTVKGERVAHNVRAAKAIVKDVAKPILQEYGAKVLSKQAERKAKIDTQVAASKSEPRGATSTSAPPPPVDAKAALQKFKDEYVTKNGQAPSAEELIKFRRSLG